MTLNRFDTIFHYFSSIKENKNKIIITLTAPKSTIIQILKISKRLSKSSFYLLMVLIGAMLFYDFVGHSFNPKSMIPNLNKNKKLYFSHSISLTLG